MKGNHIDISADSELLVLSEGARLIGRNAEPTPAINGTLRLLSQLLGLNRGRVVLPNWDDGTLSIRYAYGLTDEERSRGIYGFGEGVTGKVFTSGQVALIQDIDHEPTYLMRAVKREVLPIETVAYIAVPILQDEIPIGVLATHRIRGRNRPFHRDISILQVIATFISQIQRIDKLLVKHITHRRVDNPFFENSPEDYGAAYGILGNSTALHQAFLQVRSVADTSTTAILQGESGTGKEKFAHMLHQTSSRRSGPFVSINCAAIPQTLIESELFGYEKGAFTGAGVTKKGKIELASGGTLFLDEIGDLHLELQAKLLRVLEQQVIQRVGSIKDIPVDVRIVSATHKNLQSAVNNGSFRLDLFYRLNVFPIRLPALRERTGDVTILARHCLNMANKEYDRDEKFGPGVLEHLEGYEWPGNIRQLENVIKRVVLLSPNGVITRELVEEILEDESFVTSVKSQESAASIMYSHSQLSEQTSPPNNQRPYAWVSEDEREIITHALKIYGGNKTRAAVSLGMTLRQLRYRMSKLNISQSVNTKQVSRILLTAK